MAKLVRWLGAFGRGDSLEAAARFELSHEREVACEPLFRGRTRLHAGIGLVVDPARSRFVFGFLRDAWTEVQVNGCRLRPASHPRERSGRPYRDWDRFSAAFSRRHCRTHGEAVVDFPLHVAVAVRDGVSERTRQIAAALADDLGLPLEVIPMDD